MFKERRTIKMYNEIKIDLTHRAATLQHAIDELSRLHRPSGNVTQTGTTANQPALEGDSLFRLAVVDLFVEKAQKVLTKRAIYMMLEGMFASLSAVIALSVLGVVIGLHLYAKPHDLSDTQLIAQVVGAISLGAIVLVAVKYFIALARSFFHEAMVLLARRHALRFGRMYMYLNPSERRLDILSEAFNWNQVADSSFLDIKPSDIGQTPYSALASGIGQAAAKAFDKEVRDQRRGLRHRRKWL